MKGFSSYLVFALLCPAVLDAQAVLSKQVQAGGEWRHSFTLHKDQTLSINVHIPKPDALPANGRLRFSWNAPDAAASWSKVLHALDPDVSLFYKAPVAGEYTILIAPVENERVLSHQARTGSSFRMDIGAAPFATAFPAKTPWPGDRRVPLAIDVQNVDAGKSAGAYLEFEPNNGPGQAIEIATKPDKEQTIVIFGGADDIEYFNNLELGSGEGDDWFRIEWKGARPMLLTANLQFIEPIVPGRLRFYHEAGTVDEKKSKGEGNATDPNHLGRLELPFDAEKRKEQEREFQKYSKMAGTPEGLVINYDHRDPNESRHQQDDVYRKFITRMLRPGGVYYLRVEANHPAYEVELRVIEPPPYKDPIRALRQGMYYQVAEVNAWMVHRPRKIATYQRARNKVSLFGMSCMSCHAQSGVWGVAEAASNGHPIPPGNQLNYRQLVQFMYESGRPTNGIPDACVNTSTQPADYGDGLAGTRVTGQNMVLAERYKSAPVLHAHQHIRTANYVLATGDPGSINAAGKGANFGPNVVFKFAGQILRQAWDDTHDSKYLIGLEKRGRSILNPNLEKNKNAVADDLGHRIEFVHNIWPKEYLAQIEKLLKNESYLKKRTPEAARKSALELDGKLRKLAEQDLDRLLTTQQPDGGWSFDLPRSNDGGKTWQVKKPAGKGGSFSHPAPTAVALVGFHAAGLKREHPAVKQAIAYLLTKQTPYGLWKGGGTGFVTTAYVCRALGYYFKGDETAHPPTPKPDSTHILPTLLQARLLATDAKTESSAHFLKLAEHTNWLVRYWAAVGLGCTKAPEGLVALLKFQNDPSKPVREAAAWALRQHILEDRGWPELFQAFKQGDALTRESILRTLNTRMDIVGTKSKVDKDQFIALLEKSFSDPFAGVRALSFRAARHWWMWTPSLRERLSKAWVESFQRHEPDAQVETAFRYATQSLLLLKHQSGSKTNEFKGHKALIKQIFDKREASVDLQREIFDRRLTGIAATYHRQRSIQGPDQVKFGHESLPLGKAILAVLDSTKESPGAWRQIASEAALHNRNPQLQQLMLSYLLKGTPEAEAAAHALSNPVISLKAEPATFKTLIGRLQHFIEHNRSAAAEAETQFLSRVRIDFQKAIPVEQEEALYRTLYAPLENVVLNDRNIRLAGLLGRILNENRHLHRKSVFALVKRAIHTPLLRHFWLASTRWMLSFVDGEAGIRQGPPPGALQAEKLKVNSMTKGRRDVGLAEGIASENKFIWWRQGRPGDHIEFKVPAKKHGLYAIEVQFITLADAAIVRPFINGQEVQQDIDLYKTFVSSTGPISLGVHELKKGENLLKFKMVGVNDAAEKKEYRVGIDYIAVTEDVIKQLEAKKTELGITKLDELATSRAVVERSFVLNLQKDAPKRSRDLARKLLNEVAIRNNPRIRDQVIKFAETADKNTKDLIAKLFDKDQKAFRGELRKAIQKEHAAAGKKGEAKLDDATFKDIVAFRDGVWLELNTINPDDRKSCISCHGVPGKVPPLYLNPPDSAGRIATPKLLENYRKLQGVVDRDNPKKSRLLYKPISDDENKEDGHQGGQRYDPDDAGYQVIVKWVMGQVNENSSN